MFNLKTFVTSLQVSWINRAQLCVNDNWKLKLSIFGNGNVLDCNLYATEDNTGPALNNIIKSYSTFKQAYNFYKSNFLLDKIFNNPWYGTGRQSAFKFDENFFGEDLMANYGPLIRSLQWKQFIINESVVEKEEFTFLTGIPIDTGRYKKLKNCLMGLLKRWHIRGNVPISLADYISRVKKGSKRYRVILEKFNCKTEQFFALDI